MPTGGTLSVDLKVSLLGQGLVTVLAGTALAVIFFLQISIWIFLGALVVIALIWAWLMHRINRFRWRRIVVSQKGNQVVLISRDKHREAGRLKRRLIISPLVSCFSVEGDQGHHWLCLFSDSAETSSWRRLVALLKES